MRVLDVGSGTGRIASRLSESPLHVVALEPSGGMVEQLRTKAPRLPVVLGDGELLPFQDRCFDAVVIARLLYLTVNWRRIVRESSRVLRNGGRLLHEWGNGADDEMWVRIREKARSLFEAAGIDAPFHPGARSEVAVDDHLVSIGFTRETALSLGRGPSITAREFIRRIESGEFSYVWNVPMDVRQTCLPQLQAWAEQTLDMDREMPMPRDIRWTIYRRPD
jgi:SAM-dependent methyltransferase